MPSEPTTSPASPARLVARLEQLHKDRRGMAYPCEPECFGRCKVCPAEWVEKADALCRDLLSHLQAREHQIARIVQAMDDEIEDILAVHRAIGSSHLGSDGHVMQVLKKYRAALAAEGQEPHK